MGFFDDITSSIKPLTDFLGSKEVQGVASLGKMGYDIYSGIQGASAASKAQDRAYQLASQQAAYSQQMADRLANLYYPIEQLQAQYAKEDIQALRPLQQEQIRYGAERGRRDIELARGLDPYLDRAQAELVSKLSESPEALAGRLRGQATGDIQQAFGKAEQQGMRQMAQYGGPTSGAAQEFQRGLLTSRALGEAGARTQATRQAEDIALGRQAQALNYRMGIPLQPQQFTPSTTPTGVSAGLGSAAALQQQMAGAAGKQAERNLAGAQYAFKELQDLF